jgi:hypothetical protein
MSMNYELKTNKEKEKMMFQGGWCFVELLSN